MVFDALLTESEYLQMSITSSAKVAHLCPTEGGEEAAKSIEAHTSPSSRATLKQGFGISLFHKVNLSHIPKQSRHSETGKFISKGQFAPVADWLVCYDRHPGKYLS